MVVFRKEEIKFIKSCGGEAVKSKGREIGSFIIALLILLSSG